MLVGRSSKLLTVVLVIVLMLSGCSSDDSSNNQPAGPDAETKNLNAQVASYDLAAGGKSRFIVGLFTSDENFVSWGRVDLEFFYLGRNEASNAPEEVGPTGEGRFLPVPDSGGGEFQPREGPIAVPASEGRGVYEALVKFAKPGFWGVRVTVDFKDGPTQTADASFAVLPQHEVPTLGDQAPRTENLTIDSSDAPIEAVDSRAQGDGDVPDPELHESTVADSIRKGRPAVIVISTPVYCVSRFCGPITDMVASLSKEFGQSVDFIHIEVWRNFEKQVLNKGAADWIYRGESAAEPWVFVVDGDGVIVERLDNVATADEIRAAIEKTM